MIPLNYIEKVVTDFYTKATTDILIGYHFRHIEDFDTHIPRIIEFWNLQLNGNINDKTHLPFRFMDAHLPLKINRGEIFRWKKLFEATLIENNLEKEMINQWMAKVHLFASKLEARI